MSKKAIVVGAGGLVGSSLIRVLLATPIYQEIVIIARKKMPKVSNYKIKQIIIDFDNLADYTAEITGDAIFCCLGSTRKKTPDMAQYRKIDHDYPLLLAQLAFNNGVKQYHLISALGADAASSNFYQKMKGETEEDIKKVGIAQLHIYQPSLLTGNRKEQRIGERIAINVMKLVNPFLLGGLKKYRSIPAHTVADAMVKISLKSKDGVFIYPSNKIKELA